MLEILELTGENIFGFRVEGRVEKADVERAFTAMEKGFKNNGRVKIYAEVKHVGIGDLSAEAIKEDIRFWLKNPRLIPNIEKAAIVTDTEWVKTAFAIECALIPTLTGKSFSSKEDAMDWLKMDQRAQSRMDVTFSEFAETATLKVAGGFALGLLTASLFSSKQRKNIGLAVMFGAVAIGLPLGIKMLNNNRNLLGA